MNLVTSIDSGDCCLPNKLTEYCTDCSCKILGKKSSDTNYLRIRYLALFTYIFSTFYVLTHFAICIAFSRLPSTFTNPGWHM